MDSTLSTAASTCMHGPCTCAFSTRPVRSSSTGTCRAGPRPSFGRLHPFRDGLVVGVECMFAWYWVADLCQQEGIAFVLGHALYMKAIHGGKAKNDRIGAGKIARLLKGGTFPLAYAYPRACARPATCSAA